MIENTVISCTIERKRGDDGSVNITWGVYQSTGTGEVEATEDFQQSRGVLLFNAGDRLRVSDVNGCTMKLLYEVTSISWGGGGAWS